MANDSSAVRTAKNWSAIAILLVVPVIAALGYVAWEIHTLTPRVRTPVVINRNSLLPHQFAGVCENCHSVREIGPVEMNKDNMKLFNLTAEQKRLLVAGQSVHSPSLLQRIRMPAISRVDSLPHPYVGVCTNCHIVLDVTPSREVAQRAMRRAYQPLMMGPMSVERIARGGVRERDQRAFWRNFFGFTALGLFLVACVYIVMRFLMRRYPEAIKGKFKIKTWFTVHEWCSSAFCIAAILHWHFSDRGNMLLHLSLLIVIWLTLAGYVLRYRVAERVTSKNVRLLHTQRGLFVGLVVLLVLGHLFAGFT